MRKTAKLIISLLLALALTACGAAIETLLDSSQQPETRQEAKEPEVNSTPEIIEGPVAEPIELQKKVAINAIMLNLIGKTNADLRAVFGNDAESDIRYGGQPHLSYEMPDSPKSFVTFRLEGDFDALMESWNQYQGTHAYYQNIWDDDFTIVSAKVWEGALHDYMIDGEWPVTPEDMNGSFGQNPELVFTEEGGAVSGLNYLFDVWSAAYTFQDYTLYAAFRKDGDMTVLFSAKLEANLLYKITLAKGTTSLLGKTNAELKKINGDVCDSYMMQGGMIADYSGWYWAVYPVAFWLDGPWDDMMDDWNRESDGHGNLRNPGTNIWSEHFTVGMIEAWGDNLVHVFDANIPLTYDNLAEYFVLDSELSFTPAQEQLDWSYEFDIWTCNFTSGNYWMYATFCEENGELVLINVIIKAING